MAQEFTCCLLKPSSSSAMFVLLSSPRTHTTTPCTSSSSPFPESVFQHSEQPFEDQRPQQSGALTQLPPLTGYEPNRTAEDWDYRYLTRDGQFTELEDLRVRLLFFHQSITASTYDSAESIATCQESDFDDEQLRDLLASPLYIPEQGASAERSQVLSL